MTTRTQAYKLAYVCVPVLALVRAKPCTLQMCIAPNAKFQPVLVLAVWLFNVLSVVRVLPVQSQLQQSLSIR